jgi:hypothetical protein
MNTATGLNAEATKQRLYFDTVDIIEWLRHGDCQTGRRLFDELEPLGKASKPKVTARFTSVESRSEFLAALRAIAADARLRGHSVVLQIETRGCLEGIGLGPEEFLRWSEFKDELTAINQIGRLNLLVILAACDGAHLLNVTTNRQGAGVCGHRT